MYPFFLCEQEKIALTLAFTPAASRAGSQERSKAANGDDDGTGSSAKTPAKKDRDSFTVKHKRAPTSLEKALNPHPMEGILNCGTGKGYLPEASADLVLERAIAANGKAGGSSTAESIPELAVRVAAGSIIAPTFGFGKRSSIIMKGKETNSYQDCPALPKGQLVARWNALQSLVYCIAFHCASFNEDNFQTPGVPSKDERVATGGKIQGSLHVDAMIEMLEQAASAKGASDVFCWYLVQFVCLLTSPDFVNALKDESLLAEREQGDENSTHSGSRSRAMIDLISTKEVGKKVVNILLGLVSETDLRAIFVLLLI